MNSNSENPRGAIVLGSSYRSLGVVRSLGRHGIPVWVLSDEDRLAVFSRYAKRSMPWPDSDEPDQTTYLLDLGKRYSLDGWALYPTGDETAALLARHHALLSTYFRVTVPPWEVLRWAYDKRLTHQLAADLGVPCPWTFYPRDRSDLLTLDGPFPVILKPAIKQGFNPFVHAKAWPVQNRQELIARYDEACTMVPPDIIMIQEMIPGGGESQFSYAALAIEGRPVVSLVARRTRQYPIDFGHSSSYVETVRDHEVEEQATCVLAGLCYTGLIQIQFKRDSRDGQLKLLDINPRIWGSHTLSRRFGGDFPYLWWQWMRNEPIPEIRVPAGIHWIHGLNDFRAAITEIRAGRASMGKCLRDYMRSLGRPLECAVLASDDPVPALVEVPLMMQQAWAHRFPSLVLQNSRLPHPKLKK